jgi:arylsulfatase A-like enzyme
LAAFAWAAFGTCAAPEPSPPDLVLVTFDTTRADHLGAYGYFRETSPNFDALAAKSLLFERHVVPIATTLPSHTSMFTGVLPLEHGIEGNFHIGKIFVPATGLEYLAEYFADTGYETAAFISSLALFPASGVGRGFSTFDTPLRNQRRAEQTTNAALDWLAHRSGAQPMFLWVHYYDPHTPLRAPPPYFRNFRSSEKQTDYLVDNHFLLGAPKMQVVRRHNRYDEEVLFMDFHFGRLVEALKAHLRWDQTVLVVAGDHGEGLNQHAHWTHGMHWGEQLHAPLLMRFPGEEPRRIDTLVSTIDIFPTVLGRIDLPEEERWLDQVTGRDVLANPTERPVFGITPLWRVEQLGEDRAWTLSTSEWKYVEWSGQSDRMLFNLARDPLELTNLAESKPDVLDELAARLAAMKQAQLERREAFGAGGQIEAPSEVLEALEALGYVGRDAGEAAEEPGD